MTPTAPFDAAVVEGVARTIGESFTGSALTNLLHQVRLPDPGAAHTKWRRVAQAISDAQATRRSGKPLLNLLVAVAAPARWTADRRGYEDMLRSLNVTLAFAGLEVRDDGQVHRQKTAKTLDDVAHLTKRMRHELERRGGHPEVFKYCTEALLAEDCFSAVFESVKGLAERVRQMAGVQTDGSKLIQDAFEGAAPRILFNTWETASERDEQKGLASLMKGVIWAFRNPPAHAPRILWHIDTEDALDLLTTMSLLHRRLDRATTQLS
jgi:uncharacterized protein (TIGR02391 family)